MESIVAGKAPYETWNPATAVPVVGTDICGFPREGVSVSFSGSHVHIDGWRLKSVNHSHAVSIVSGIASRRTRILALTPHLHRPVLSQKLLGSPYLLGGTFDPDSIIAVAKAWIVSNHHRKPRNAGVDEKANDGREPSNQNHYLEAEDRVWRDRKSE